jgi:hypothetical protein
MRARSDLFRRFERAGFILVRCTNHAIWRCPCGHAQVTTPCTPGKGRSTDNCESLLARTLRACSTQPMKECS